MKLEHPKEWDALDLFYQHAQIQACFEHYLQWSPLEPVQGVNVWTFAEKPFRELVASLTGS